VAAIIIVIHKTGVINDHCLRIYPTLQKQRQVNHAKSSE